MKIRPLLVTTMSVLFCYSVNAAPMLYSDYLYELEAPVSDRIQKFAMDGTKPERIVNILLKQSKKVSIDTVDIFLHNIDYVQHLAEYKPYIPLLESARIQAYFLSGNILRGIDTIKAQPAENQNEYGLLLAAAYLQIDQKDDALDSFNRSSSDYFEKDKERYLLLAKDMILNYGISSESIELPNLGKQLLTKDLATTYTDSGAFDRALVERRRLLDATTNVLERQLQRQSLAAFAKKHDLVRDEVSMMDDYLLSASNDGKGKIVVGDKDVINTYTNDLITYYSDARNKHKREVQDIVPLLKAQQAVGESNEATHILYLENILSLYDKARPESYYRESVELAALTKDASRVVDVYKHSLPGSTRKHLLSGYFSIVKSDPDKNKLFMAKEYLPFIKQCDAKAPALVRALKGHELAQTSDINNAYHCFASVDFSEFKASELSPEFISGLVQEREHVSYVYMKQTSQMPEVYAIAKKSDDIDIRFDAALTAIDSQSLDAARVSELFALQKELRLTQKQQSQLNEHIVDLVRKGNDRKLLFSLLKRAPERHALELAYISMDFDNSVDSVKYLLMYFNQQTSRQALSKGEEIKVVRYLDSVVPRLSSNMQRQLEQIHQPYIQQMLAYRKIDVQMANAFKAPAADLPIMDAISQGLNEYNEFKNKLSPIPEEPNYTAQLWLLSELDRKFSDYLTELADGADENIVTVLNTQISGLRQQSEQNLKQLLSLKVEGVTDYRVLSGMLMLKQEDSTE
ncbi:MAG: hypothetical protein ACK5NL_04650 [Vibrio fluvialis]